VEQLNAINENLNADENRGNFKKNHAGKARDGKVEPTRRGASIWGGRNRKEGFGGGLRRKVTKSRTGTRQKMIGEELAASEK